MFFFFTAETTPSCFYSNSGTRPAMAVKKTQKTLKGYEMPPFDFNVRGRHTANVEWRPQSILLVAFGRKNGRFCH